MITIKITNYVPDDDWRSLQNNVCKLLLESGYSAETEKTIDTVRGPVEVDVYAASNFEFVKEFICECKCWNVNIPKEKIHAFRTVVSDSGSMFGIFIVKKGYQSGAYAAAYRSNVLLKTWDEFLELIAKQWFIRQFIKIKKIASPLAVYTDPFDIPTERLSALEIQKHKILIENSIIQYMTIRSLELSSMEKETIEFDGISFNAFDELFTYAEGYFLKVIQEFEELFKNVQIEEFKFETWEHMMVPLFREDLGKFICEIYTETF